jgi:hypothetical protein
MEHAGRHHYLFTGASQMGRGRSEPWVGRGGGSSEVGVESVFRGRGRVRALGSGEAEFVVFRGRAKSEP